MNPKGYIKLEINEEYRKLIPPLKKEEYTQLELNLVVDGCREAIIAWNNTIVDGHNRYEICNRLKIPYAVREAEFESHEAVVAWICANQLGRRNISEETYKYLIGKQYEAEKIVGYNRNKNGNNQFQKNNNHFARNDMRCAKRISQEHRISPGTVQKYAKYSNAIDLIAEKAPKLAPQILSGNYKISHKNLMTLSSQGDEKLIELNNKISGNQCGYTRFKESRQEISKIDTKRDVNVPAIKNMPTFDPDAQVTQLTLTVPTWTSSMERIKSTDLSAVSLNAKSELNKVLLDLYEQITEIRRALDA